jgi:Putative F0F1-ATPase subunit Ca2+/Mg2+ transporter
MGGLPPAARLVGIGWYVAICIAFGVGGGVWLDNKFDLSPVLTLGGLFLGLGLAFWGGYRMLMDVISAVGPKKRS